MFPALLRSLLCLSLLSVPVAQLPAQIPGPTYRHATADWAAAVLYPDGSFSQAPGANASPFFPGASMTIYFPGWATFASEESFRFSSELYPNMPPVGSVFYFTAQHPETGSYMGWSTVSNQPGDTIVWHPWRHGEGPLPTLGTVPFLSDFDSFVFSLEDVMIVDRPEERTFVACDLDSMVFSALTGRQMTLKATYLDGNALTGECEINGVVQPSGSSWYVMLTWGDPSIVGQSEATCGSMIPTGPFEIEFTIEGYAPVRTRVMGEASRYSVWYPILYPELGSDAPGATQLLQQAAPPPSLIKEFRLGRITGEVDYFMGRQDTSVDRNGDGVLDAADVRGDYP